MGGHLGKIIIPNRKMTPILGYLYAFLFVIVGWFLTVYASTLIQRPGSFSLDVGLKYLVAAFLILVVFGSIINWLRDCTYNVQAGLPTFGLENRVTLLG